MVQAVFTIGSRIPSDGSVDTWLATATQEPMPVKYDVSSIANLFSPSYFPDDAKIAAKVWCAVS